MPFTPPKEPAPVLHGHRAAILRFDAQGSPLYESDGLLVVETAGAGGRCARIVDVGSHQAVLARHPGLAVTHWPGKLIAPGFIDLHLHYPQTDIIGAPADGLLPWLETYTFPAESRFADAGHAAEVAGFFLNELTRHGVTTALVFASSHPESVQALFNAAWLRGLRLITGKVLQDRHCPDGVRDDTEQGLVDSEELIDEWHLRERLGYAITPRFAPTSSDAQLRGAGELAAFYPDTWIQSHVAENLDETRWVRELFPEARSYLDVYARAGLLRPRAVYAHCIHLDDADRALMRECGSAAAVSPTSNLFLGSGFFDFEAAARTGMAWGLASDVGGGTSFSPFHTMLAAYYVGREGQTKPGLSLRPSALWWHHTGAAAAALGLEGVVGNLQPGCEADFIVLDPQATPLLARRTALAANLEELLFAMIVLGDDRLVVRSHIAARPAD
ncbi:guanine deaminase [Corticibacter populi]|uniref:Guanine deaminase n=1 Tax=Corticibacter populi TaxID=1550736 RepID=A0A3M6R1M1_9BURK|nr:guanine deaminase [Corticibacter populi]RMX08819.1 guanine deaminase [Corticibacter populi]RZS34977.1 guanine deaminase [Corticibacter populi]